MKHADEIGNGFHLVTREVEETTLLTDMRPE
jgi:hypothetical protein